MRTSPFAICAVLILAPCLISVSHAAVQPASQDATGRSYTRTVPLPPQARPQADWLADDDEFDDEFDIDFEDDDFEDEFESDGGDGQRSNHNPGWQLKGSDIVWTSDFVGINVMNPSARLDVKGASRFRGNVTFNKKVTVQGNQITPGLRIFNHSHSPNVIGGHSANAIGAGVVGASIGGGGTSSFPNQVLDNHATIAGGYGNVAGIFASTIGGGELNTTSGVFATIPGGLANTAAGDYSFAAGPRAKANHNGSFVLSDSVNADFASSASNRFHARFANGYWLYTDTNASLGVQVSANGTSWSAISDRNVKHNVSPVDPVDIAHRLASIPISQWTYINDDRDVPHMGPMAQDFYEAFRLGDLDTHIATLDADGVLFAAVQGVYRQVQDLAHEKDAEIAELTAQNAELEARLARLEAAVLRGQN